MKRGIITDNREEATVAAKKKPKQTSIPGTERKVNKAVRTAAENYVEVRDERMDLTKMEVAKRDLLIEVMKKFELTTYRDEDADLEVTLDVTEKCRVKKLSSGSGDE